MDLPRKIHCNYIDWHFSTRNQLTIGNQFLLSCSAQQELFIVRDNNFCFLLSFLISLNLLFFSKLLHSYDKNILTNRKQKEKGLFCFNSWFHIKVQRNMKVIGQQLEANRHITTTIRSRQKWMCLFHWLAYLCWYQFLHSCNFRIPIPCNGAAHPDLCHLISINFRQFQTNIPTDQPTTDRPVFLSDSELCQVDS